MFGIPLGVASLLGKLGAKKLFNKAKEKAMDKGMEFVAEELIAKPQGLIDEWGESHGLKLSQAMKRIRLGVAEDFVRDRITQYAAAVARGIDSDD